MNIPQPLVKDTVEHTIEVLANAFTKDTFHRFLLLNHLRLDNSTQLTPSVNRKLFDELIPPMVMDGAFLVTMPGSSISSVW